MVLVVVLTGSSNVRDESLRRACRTTRMMFADSRLLRSVYYKMHGRVIVIAQDKRTTEVPEYSHLEAEYWDSRARGLGPTTAYPATSSSDENLQCLSKYVLVHTSGFVTVVTY